MKASRNCRRKRLGQTLVEFTFVGIPMLFVLISIFEISRGMWIYHTLSYSVKAGIRYAIVHGINCATTTDNPNNCLVQMGPATTAGTIAYVIRQAGIGLDPATTTITFFSVGSASTSCTLASSSCTGVWPPYDATGATSLDAVGSLVRIDITTPFKSALAMLWPGAKPVSFASGTLGATSQDYIQF
jgi:Flp pilus assembly protein TadG